MEQLVPAASQHGYSILFILVFLEAVGFPVPAAIALLIAGGASAHGPLQPVASVVTALGAMLLGDTTLYMLGRYTGWALLGFLCRLSLNPESCILQPNALNQGPGQLPPAQLPKEKKIVLYCTCSGEATSKRVARALAEHGFAASVIVGGLRAWKKAGLPLEPVPADDVVQLPTFL